MTRSRQTADWGSRAGLAKIVPSSVAVGSGTGSANTFGTVTFTTVSSVSLNDVFSSTYDNYKIVCNVKGSTNLAVQFRYRVSNADNTSSLYSFGRISVDNSGTSDNTGASVQTSFTNICNTSTEFYGSFDLSVYAPFKTERTTFNGSGSGLRTNYTAGAQYLIGSLYESSTSFTGFTLIASTGTITGTVSVLGYNN